MSKLSRQIEVVRVAESRLTGHRDELDRNVRRLFRRTRRWLMPYGLLAGGVLSGVLSERWLFAASRGSQERHADTEADDPAPAGRSHRESPSLIRELGNLLALANRFAPVAMHAMELHQRWQDRRERPTEAAKPDSEASAESAAAEASGVAKPTQ